MTQDQFNHRLTAAVVRLGEIMTRGNDIGEQHADVMRSLKDAAQGGAGPFVRKHLAVAEETIDMLAEALPPDARCADAAMLERAKALALKPTANEIPAPESCCHKEHDLTHTFEVGDRVQRIANGPSGTIYNICDNVINVELDSGFIATYCASVLRKVPLPQPLNAELKYGDDETA